MLCFKRNDMNRLLLPLLFLIPLCLSAQIGGDNVYEFLNLANSPRITALGGNLITLRDDDLSVAAQNPAALNPAMHLALTFNHNFHLAGIQNGYFAYGHYMKKWQTTFHAGVQYVDYGDFQWTDETGLDLGTFKASDNAIFIGAGREVYEKLSVGANMKVVLSQLESYNSVGLLGDLSATFSDTARRFTATLAFRNFGGQLSTYEPENRESMPYDVQIGISKRLRYLPFRFSVIYHNLHRWNILYDDPNSEETLLFLGQDQSDQGNPFVDNLFRHFIFNGEFLFGKKENLRVQVGYNHLRNRELSVDNFRSLAGFSFGLGLKIKQFRVEYGRGIYHLAGSLHHLGISTSIREFTTKKFVD